MMPWARAAVRSWVRPGSARENHSGVPSGRAMASRVHPVPLVLLAVVRLIRGDPVGRDRRPAGDDEVSFTQPDQSLTQARGPGGEDLERLVHVPPGRGDGDTETAGDLLIRLVLPQIRQDQQGLLETTQPPPRRLQLTPTGMDQPREMLNELVRDIEHGRIRNHRAPRPPV